MSQGGFSDVDGTNGATTPSNDVISVPKIRWGTPGAAAGWAAQQYWQAGGRATFGSREPAGFVYLDPRGGYVASDVVLGGTTVDPWVLVEDQHFGSIVEFWHGHLRSDGMSTFMTNEGHSDSQFIMNSTEARSAGWYGVAAEAVRFSVFTPQGNIWEATRRTAFEGGSRVQERGRIPYLNPRYPSPN